MEWLSANWVWILIAIAFVAMHMFGHGGHGGHGGSGRRDSRRSAEEGAEDGLGHRH